MLNEVDEKLVDLEVRLSFQEDTIDQLNDVILFQNKKIGNLERQIKMIVSKLNSAESDETVYDQRPPHY